MTSPYPIATIIGVLIVALSIASGLIWLERRLLALWQDRYGPNRVGPFGLLQVVADMIKIFTKEDWIPPFADKPVFVLAPAIIVVTVLMTFAVLPIAPGIIVTDLNIGLLFFLAMSSLGVYSVVLAGWSSDNKYSLLGGLRAAAQMLSYEVFMGLSLMGVVVLAGSFDLGQDRRSAKEDVVCDSAVSGLRTVSYRGHCRNASLAVRSARSRERTGCRLPLGIFRNEVWNVLRRRVSGRHADLSPDRGIVFRRMAGSVVAANRLVFHQDVSASFAFLFCCARRCRGRVLISSCPGDGS